MNVRDEIAKWAREVLTDPRTAILDTETTGLNGYACEIAILGIDGEFLVNTLVNPGVAVEPSAYAVHGLGEAELSAAPPFGDLWSQLAEIVIDRRIIVYNAPFDSGVIRREITRLGAWRPKLEWECAMVRYSDWLAGCYGARWVRLNGGHRAGDDCVATLERIREMAAE